MSFKRRRVSFGGLLRPELSDENLPPNAPLKRGETLGKRKSLGLAAPAVLEKITRVNLTPTLKLGAKEPQLKVVKQDVQRQMLNNFIVNQKMTYTEDLSAVPSPTPHPQLH
ncbi:cell division cycle-associated protein 2-like [Dugong dugon]